MARLLITGGSSYLGQNLVPLARSQHDIAYTYLTNNPWPPANGYRLDVLDSASVRSLIGDFRPHAIIHTVGSNRVANMHEIIVEGTRNVTLAASDIGARLIHISTDVVFNGRTGNYVESDLPSPIHAYGRSKAAAEEIVKLHNDHVIVRTSLIYGLLAMDHGTRWMANALDDGQSITLFSDQRRNPVWLNTLSESCLELVANGYVGVVNVAGKEKMSRAEFGLRMLDHWQIEQRHLVTVGPSDGEKWPLDCTLNLKLAQSLLRTPLLGLEDVMAIHNTKGSPK